MDQNFDSKALTLIDQSKDNLLKILNQYLKIHVGNALKIREHFQLFLNNMKKFDEIKEEAT